MPLRQPRAEAVGPLGVLHQGKRGCGLVDDIFLNIAGGKHRVDIDALQPRLYPLHQGGVHHALQVQHVHRGHRLPPYDLFPQAQLRRLQVAAAQAGVGAHRLHKGIPGSLEHRFVFRLADGALFLRAYVEGQDLRLPRKQQQAVALHQVEGRAVCGAPALYPQIVEGPLLHGGHQLRHVRAVRQGRVLRQRPQNIVADPLHPHHAADVAQGDHLFPVPRQADVPFGEVRAAGKDRLQAFQRQGQVIAGLFPGVGRHALPCPAKKSHGPHLLFCKSFYEYDRFFPRYAKSPGAAKKERSRLSKNRNRVAQREGRSCKRNPGGASFALNQIKF